MIGEDITIGQYLARDTMLHHMDPRLKIIAVAAGSILIFFYSSGWDLLAFVCLLLAILLMMGLPLLPVLKSIRTVWVIVLVTALLQFLFTPGRVILHWGFISITDAGLFNGIVFSARVLILVVLLATLTMTTPPLSLADGLESLLGPLRHLKIPVDRVSTLVSITLMFIPNILEGSRKVIRAQMARGADFESWNLLRRVKDIVPVLVPLFVKTFHDADELALAMDARAYSGGKGRTRLHPLSLGVFETALTFLFVAAAISIVFLI